MLDSDNTLQTGGWGWGCGGVYFAVLCAFIYVALHVFIERVTLQSYTYI